MGKIMLNKLLKKYISLAMAFAVVLSLSCCGVSDEVMINETPTETTTSETAQEEITEEPTTNETTEEVTEETTTEEVTELTTEAITISIPDETAEAILASLSDEEKEVWLSMPDIVTMRLLSRYDEEEKKYYSEFLYNEIIYIDKIGQVKKFIVNDDPNSPDYNIAIAWLNEKISENEDVEIINVADIHTLIEFYNAFMCIDSDSKWVSNYTVGLAKEFYRHYWFELYGIRNNSENNLETLFISKGDAGDYELRRNNTDEGEPRDRSGRETFDLYLQLDPFMVKGGGGEGHLTGEKK